MHLGSGHDIVIDARVSLEVFLAAFEADEDAGLDRLIGEHTRRVRKTWTPSRPRRTTRRSPTAPTSYVPAEGSTLCSPRRPC
ncbi:hypothetical protein [Actinomadura chokoriensis]|uniref:hypothetical protein n=1 Tax=Actinomadura chokoriensis TaxID=454156 RepID=UPI003565F555